MELLSIILQAVITAVVPVVSAFIVAYIKAKRDAQLDNTSNQNMRNIVNTAGDVVTNAVAYVSQTYVDGLKKSGQFSIENQKQAFQMAYDRAVQLINDDSAAVIAAVFGNFSEWLTTAIEVAVRTQKMYE